MLSKPRIERSVVATLDRIGHVSQDRKHEIDRSHTWTFNTWNSRRFGWTCNIYIVAVGWSNTLLWQKLYDTLISWCSSMCERSDRFFRCYFDATRSEIVHYGNERLTRVELLHLSLLSEICNCWYNWRKEEFIRKCEQGVHVQGFVCENSDLKYLLGAKGWEISL